MPDTTAQTAPLPPQQRAFFERGFGQDFSQVRVHTGPDAGAFARSMGAKAVTSGDDIAFAQGRFAPDSTAGRTLLAHELAHVAQQRQGGGSDASESRARSAAQTVADGGHAPAQSLGGAEPGGLHCDPDDDAKKSEEAPLPPPLLPYRLPNWRQPSLMPPLNFTPTPNIDWLSMRSSFGDRGMPFTMRDGDSINSEWMRSKALLENLGIDERFKFWFINQNWILNKGIKYQLDTNNARDNPNAMDRGEREFKNAYPDAKGIPPLPFFTQEF
ncbi:MAG: DUF4157 domain-containing protein [Lysobacter sp.]|nr:DUF4157 domain-containing protein [Lysobacter sp.]